MGGVDFFAKQRYTQNFLRTIMNIAEIREKSREDIETALLESREALRTVRFGIAEHEVKNHQEHRRLRREIARMLTVLGEQK